MVVLLLLALQLKCPLHFHRILRLLFYFCFTFVHALNLYNLPNIGHRAWGPGCQHPCANQDIVLCLSSVNHCAQDQDVLCHHPATGHRVQDRDVVSRYNH